MKKPGPGSAMAIAHSNIALAKYWGKADVSQNLPAVPSLSLTLDNLRTATRVTFVQDLDADEAILNGTPASGRPLERIALLLERVRRAAGGTLYARVESINDFPTAAGLASSASGFAALALAATHALGLGASPETVSAIARASSASAARSLFGGFVVLGRAAQHAERVLSGGDWPLRMLVCVTTSGAKSVSSTDGMQKTAQTSPYYPAWLEHAPLVFEQAKRAVLAHDFAALGSAMEHSALLMHASMFAANPAVIYFSPATLEVMGRVRALREQQTPAYFTMDAGPHVKVLSLPQHAEHVRRALAEVPGVKSVIECGPGPDAHLVDGGFSLEQGLADSRARSRLGTR